MEKYKNWESIRGRKYNNNNNNNNKKTVDNIYLNIDKIIEHYNTFFLKDISIINNNNNQIIARLYDS